MCNCSLPPFQPVLKWLPQRGRGSSRCLEPGTSQLGLLQLCLAEHTGAIFQLRNNL